MTPFANLVCYTAVFSVVQGALRDDTKNGCAADWRKPFSTRWTARQQTVKIFASFLVLDFTLCASSNQNGHTLSFCNCYFYDSMPGNIAWKYGPGWGWGWRWELCQGVRFIFSLYIGGFKLTFSRIVLVSVSPPDIKRQCNSYQEGEVLKRVQYS